MYHVNECYLLGTGPLVRHFTSLTVPIWVCVQWPWEVVLGLLSHPSFSIGRKAGCLTVLRFHLDQSPGFGLYFSCSFLPWYFQSNHNNSGCRSSHSHGIFISCLQKCQEEPVVVLTHSQSSSVGKLSNVILSLYAIVTSAHKSQGHFLVS